MHKNDTVPCFNNHMGFWLAQPNWLSQTMAAIRGGIYPEASAPGLLGEGVDMQVIESVAIIHMNGVLMKGATKFGGTSTVDVRRQLRAAMNSDEVSRVILSIDSPGGHVAGTMELAQEVGRVNAVKPVVAQINDLGASAAYWVASQASEIFANEPAEIGSIGTVAVVHDTSGAYEREGIKVHVISTGPLKGAFTDGAPVTDDMLENLQARVNQLNKLFVRSVTATRTIDDIKAVTTGETFMAMDAQTLGLIDGISDLETTLENQIEQVRMTSRADRSQRLASKLASYSAET